MGGGGCKWYLLTVRNIQVADLLVLASHTTLTLKTTHGTLFLPSAPYPPSAAIISSAFDFTFVFLSHFWRAPLWVLFVAFTRWFSWFLLLLLLALVFVLVLLLYTYSVSFLPFLRTVLLFLSFPLFPPLDSIALIYCLWWFSVRHISVFFFFSLLSSLSLFFYLFYSISLSLLCSFPIHCPVVGVQVAASVCLARLLLCRYSLVKRGSKAVPSSYSCVSYWMQVFVLLFFSSE